MNERLIEHLAYKEAIKAWTGMAAATKQKIIMQRNLQGLSDEQTSQEIQILDRELEIYEAAIEQATVYLQKLGDTSSN